MSNNDEVVDSNNTDEGDHRMRPHRNVETVSTLPTDIGSAVGRHTENQQQLPEATQQVVNFTPSYVYDTAEDLFEILNMLPKDVYIASTTKELHAGGKDYSLSTMLRLFVPGINVDTFFTAYNKHNRKLSSHRFPSFFRYDGKYMRTGWILMKSNPLGLITSTPIDQIDHDLTNNNNNNGSSTDFSPYASNLMKRSITSKKRKTITEEAKTANTNNDSSMSSNKKAKSTTTAASKNGSSDNTPTNSKKKAKSTTAVANNKNESDNNILTNSNKKAKSTNTTSAASKNDSSDNAPTNSNKKAKSTTTVAAASNKNDSDNNIPTKSNKKAKSTTTSVTSKKSDSDNTPTNISNKVLLFQQKTTCPGITSKMIQNNTKMKDATKTAKGHNHLCGEGIRKFADFVSNNLQFDYPKDVIGVIRDLYNIGQDSQRIQKEIDRWVVCCRFEGGGEMAIHSVSCSNNLYDNSPLGLCAECQKESKNLYKKCRNAVDVRAKPVTLSGTRHDAVLKSPTLVKQMFELQRMEIKRLRTELQKSKKLGP